MGREDVPSIIPECPVVVLTVATPSPAHDDEHHECGESALQAPWRADAADRPHEETQIEAADAHQQSLEDVGVSAEMRASQAAGLVEMRAGAFEALAAPPLKGAAARPADAPTIRVDRVAGRRGLRPVPSAAVGLGDVGPQVERLEVRELPLGEGGLLLMTRWRPSMGA
jgi:hypothetical protein